MSQPDDLQTLRAVYDEWARGEYWNASVYDPEIVFVFGDTLPEPGVFEGIEEMGRGFRGWLESWRDLRFELEELIPVGDRILATYHQTGTGRASGARTELRGGHVWTMRDGRAVRLEVHLTRAAAFEAIGLADPGADGGGNR
jgi:ketosteroid isomerase-like protein